MRSHGHRLLCMLKDVPDGGAVGFASRGAYEHSLFAVRKGENLRVYVNRCPHAGAELEYARGQFLSRDGSRIICYAHGAQFSVATGQCLGGPCVGLRLTFVEAEVINGAVFVDEGAGSQSD